MSRLRTRFLLLTGWLGLVTGCGSSSEKAPEPTAPSFPGAALTVAAVGDPAVLTAVDSQRGEWEASRKASCSVRKEPVKADDLSGAHVVIFPGDRLGDMVDAGTLAVIPEAAVRPPAPKTDPETPDTAPAINDELQFGDVLPAYREQVSKYGSDRMGLPLGGTALVLVVNRAALEGEATRAAAKTAGVSLDLPTTWAQLDALATFLHGRDWDGDGSNDSGIALPLADDSEGLGNALVLARAASLAQHPDHYSLLFDADTMEPRLTTPPFVEALTSLVALRGYGPPGAEGLDAAAARKAFRDGKAALLIDRAERPSAWAGKAKSIAVAPLPGSDRVYEPARKAWETPRAPNRPSYLPVGGGWVVGIARGLSGAQYDAALDFARYLVNPETSNRVRTDPAFPVLPVRGSQLGQGLPDPRSAPGVDSRSWTEAVGKTLGAARVVPGLRIPQTSGYLADLAKGRTAALKGEPPAKALQTVADAWKARTKALGTERQTWHYRRSLNALATSPEPPPRP